MKYKKNKTKRNKIKKNSTKKNSIKRNRIKTNKTKRNKIIKNIKGGKNISELTINDENYTLSVYNEEDDNYESIKDEAKFICEDMYPGYSAEDTAEIVKDILDNLDELYILRDNSNQINAFMIIKYNYCDDICMNCSLKCAYILLTCVKKEKRNQKIFTPFLREIENHLKNNGISCIRLTAVNNKVYNIYKKLGFTTENKENYECEYKMIKNI